MCWGTFCERWSSLWSRWRQGKKVVTEMCVKQEIQQRSELLRCVDGSDGAQLFEEGSADEMQ